jgi:uncharacterized iron-regulated membrane protein
MLIVLCVVWLCFVLFSCAFVVWRQREHDKKENMTDGAKQNWRAAHAAGALRIFRFFLVFRSSGYTYCDLWCNQATYYHDMPAIR